MLSGLDIWRLLAGLGIFLFGMYLMEESIKQLSGRTFKRMIRTYTTGKMKSVFSGFSVTAILQSSSAVSLLVLAFVGAGIMSMENAIGVILGSNIGTTVTAWIVATLGFKLKIESFALPLIGVGGLITIFLGKSEKYASVSKLLVGFGFLFMGLDYMKGSVEVYASQIDMSTIPDYGLVVYTIIGLLLTAAMQSSSASMAVILTALNAGIMSFESAGAMVIGANVGTTVTILMGSIGGNIVKKRVALSHFVFNLVTGVLAFFLLPLLIYLVKDVFNISDAVTGLALFHTIFNVFGVLVFLPFIGILASTLIRIYPEKHLDLTLYLNKTSFDVAEAAIPAIKDESLHLLRRVLFFNLELLEIDRKLVLSIEEGIPLKNGKSLPIMEQYEQLKLLQSEIFSFSAKAQSKELTNEESVHMNRLLHGARLSLHAAKSLKDVKHDLEDFFGSDDAFLNDQYTEFRKRMIAIYMKIDKLLVENGDKKKTKGLLKLLQQIMEDDRHFVKTTSKAIAKGKVDESHISTLLIANRAFIQSSRQIIFAMREMILTREEAHTFEEISEINEELSEDF
jgi:phosphate:Na+ symporter